jgi:hypothetical protein
MFLTSSDLKSIRNAINLIDNGGNVARVDLGNNITVYKVPSNNPNKYTIRMDIKVNKEEEYEL